MSTFRYQRQRRDENRRKIIDTITEKPSTFKEIQNAVRLSDPGLSHHLRELEAKERISRRLAGRRVEYIITEKGESIEDVRKWFVTTLLKFLVSRVSDKEYIRAMRGSAKEAEENPEKFKAQLEFLREFESIPDSDWWRWEKKHPHDAEQRFRQELDKKLRSSKGFRNYAFGEKEWLEAFLKAWKDVLTPPSSRPFPLRARVARNKRMILDALKLKPSTFGELRRELGMHPSRLSCYLDELETDDQIERVARGRRREYQLTVKAEGVEAFRRNLCASGMQIGYKLAGDKEAAGIIYELAKLGERDPAFVSNFLHLYYEVLLLYSREDVITWHQQLSPEKQKRILGDELKEALRRIDKSSGPNEFVLLLRAFLRELDDVIGLRTEEAPGE